MNMQKRNYTFYSDRLYNGKVDDFLTAMDLVVAECECEIRLEAIEADEDKTDIAPFAEFKDVAQHCKAIYKAEFDKDAKTVDERVIARIRSEAAKETDTDRKRYYGDILHALETGDYTELAI